ncbi:hypothetical protein ABE218_00295 [Bacillus smithii]
MIDEFKIEFLETGRSALNVKAYSHDINQFLSWLEETIGYLY